MSMVTKNISLTDQQDSWIKARVESGLFCDASEVIRELIVQRQLDEQEPSDETKAMTQSEAEALRAEIIKGVESGPCHQSVDQIRDEIRQRRQSQQCMTIG